MEQTNKVHVQKKTNGRRKIEIKKIEKKSNLQVTFSKRRTGLFNKAAELSVLSGADVCILVESPAGKVYAFGGRASVDNIIDRYVAGGEASGSANNVVVNQLQSDYHRQALYLEEEKEISEIMKQIEIEKAKGESLMQNKGSDCSNEFWWEQPIDNLGWKELLEQKAALETLRKNVLARANHMALAAAAAADAAAANNSVDVNNNDDSSKNETVAYSNADPLSGVLIPNVAVPAYNNFTVDKGSGGLVSNAPFSASSNNTAAAYNNNADPSSGHDDLIPNLAVDSFFGLPVIHSKNNGEKNVHDQPLTLGDSELKRSAAAAAAAAAGNDDDSDDDVIFMFENPNPEIDINRPLTLAIPKLEIESSDDDHDQPALMFDFCSHETGNNLLSMLGYPNPQTSGGHDQPLMFGNPNGQAAGCSDEADPK